MVLARIEAEARAALRPPPRVPLSEWIERNIVLPSDVSALPGKVRLTRFQRGIADALRTSERVTVMKSVRVGLSTLLASMIAAEAVLDPGPMMLLLPTESDCRDVVVSDLDPILAASGLGNLMEAERSTLVSRRFAGGSLKVVAAKAPRNLRRHNVRTLLIDEADAMEAGTEGSPIVLAERRTLSFPNRRIILGGTPVDAETSNVARSYEASDRRVFEIRCPHCGGFFELLWPHLSWPQGEPAKAVAHCPECGAEIEERAKNAAVEGGRWRATRPEVEGHAGFRLNALISPLSNASWGKLAAEFEAAKDDPALLKVFHNTLLGLPWESAGEVQSEAALAARAEALSLDALPATVLFLTLGADVQADRIEATIVGHAKDGTLFALAHFVLWGDPQRGEVWGELEALLRTQWPHPLGGTIGVDAACIDAGDGRMMETVCRFAAGRAARRVAAIKGVAGFSRPPLQRSKARVPGGVLWLAGVDTLKTQIFERLRRGTSIRFSNTLEPVWYEQLASERRVVRMVAGQPTARFERLPGRRAEALDCTCYAIAARSLLPLVWAAREDELRGAPPPKPAPTVIRSAWMDRS